MKSQARRGFTEIRSLTVGNVAGALSYSRRTVRRLIESGQLAAWRAGDRGAWRVSADVLEAFIEARQREYENEQRRRVIRSVG